MILVVMGVSSCGKSSVGEGIADVLGGSFLDADGLHPASNVEKMKSGSPLTDEDRAPWLKKVGEQARIANQSTNPTVVACSCLKRSYRERIRSAADPSPVVFIHLQGSYSVIKDRMVKRDGHFMPTSLLEDQFQKLEIPFATQQPWQPSDQIPDPALVLSVDHNSKDELIKLLADMFRPLLAGNSYV